MRILNFCNKIIEYSFYLLFFLVPLALTGDTSELFEFNKLWVTFIITIVIGAFWFIKMIILKQIRIQRTPLDIFILAFLGSQIISTFLSLDTHTSLWGYYSRFNGGLTSIITFVFLYYAFVSNLLVEDIKNKKQIIQTFNITKSAMIFAGGVLFFVIGIFISSLIKPSIEAGIPIQMLSILLTAIITFVIFMKASPSGVFKKSLFAIFSASSLVILWGLPSHFGYDPTCLLFRGTLDVACWTSDFQPKVRIFSTLGQPNWMAAYLGTLIPIIIALSLNFVKDKNIFNKKNIFNPTFLHFSIYISFVILSYIAFLFTKSRTAIAGVILSLIILFVFYFWFYIRPKLSNKIKPTGLKISILLVSILLLITFVVGIPSEFPFKQISKITWPSLQSVIFKPVPVNPSKQPAQVTPPAQNPFSAGEFGGTDSTKIRSFVWKGAFEIWKNNPVFGTGVETYAYAYYLYRPQEHNMTSEWQYLYNKAHNEFLNYLATTGTVGIVTYLLMIGSVYYFGVKHILKNKKNLGQNELLIFSFLMAYTVINITNFGGFSVVIINIFFFLFPILMLILTDSINQEKAITLNFAKNQGVYFGNGQKIAAGLILAVAAFMIYTLVNFWNADRYYYYGYNYDRAGDYQKAYLFIKKAVEKRPSEPTFKDEMAYNNAVLGSAILSQSQAQKDQDSKQNQQIAKQLVNFAIETTNKVTTEHPNNIVFWKTKVRIFYTLSQLDPSYLPLALDAIKKASTLAPTDADVSYNLGVLYGQNGDFNMAVKTLENTIKLKPDYKNGGAYYALAIFYQQLALDNTGKVINPSNRQKAIDTLKLMIKYFGPNQQASDALKALGESI